MVSPVFYIILFMVEATQVDISNLIFENMAQRNKSSWEFIAKSTQIFFSHQKLPKFKNIRFFPKGVMFYIDLNETCHSAWTLT